ncbi:MAG: sodium-dependent transporter [Prevotellaceae bacterium]|nr:sodium-dependent transporter [Candidatus Faecinaster equi]
MNNERNNFRTKIGIIFATAGSAVGLGNLWRFPIETGNNGGGAFLMIYLIAIIFIGLPLMIAEFAIGRSTHANIATAYKKLSNNRFWNKIGYIGVFSATIITSYYLVVAGWTVFYLIEALSNGFSIEVTGGLEDAYTDIFSNFIANPFLSVIYTLIFILMTHLIIVKGVQKGIEKSSKIMMPMLFIIIMILAVCSIFTPGAKEGLTFLFKPNFNKITTASLLSAIGQCFYSLSLAMGCLCTYASYFKKDVNLIKTAFNISLIDTLIAILAGVIIFPAVFSVGINPEAGPSLIFITLPHVFQSVFGFSPVLVYIVSILFYVLLILATLTSAISLYEVMTAFISETYNISRNKATIIISITMVLLGSFCALSMGELNWIKICDRNIFDIFDFVSSNILLPITGMLICLFVGWKMDKDLLYKQITNKSRNTKDRHLTFQAILYYCIVFLLRYIIPIAIAIIFIDGLGII